MFLKNQNIFQFRTEGAAQCFKHKTITCVVLMLNAHCNVAYPSMLVKHYQPCLLSLVKIWKHS